MSSSTSWKNVLQDEKLPHNILYGANIVPVKSMCQNLQDEVKIVSVSYFMKKNIFFWNKTVLFLPLVNSSMDLLKVNFS